VSKKGLTLLVRIRRSGSFVDFRERFEDFTLMRHWTNVFKMLVSLSETRDAVSEKISVSSRLASLAFSSSISV
jgi:hypothetical protein